MSGYCHSGFKPVNKPCKIPSPKQSMIMNDNPEIEDQKKTEIEAAVFRKMIQHFRSHPEVQNIDLMNTGYFCRNCFSKWYMGAARELGIEVDYDQAREIIYGMPYSDYKATYQEKATDEQIEKYQHSQTLATE